MNIRSAIIRFSAIFAVAALVLTGTPQATSAAVSINVGIVVQQAPPPIPYYAQPYAPGQNYIFQPGYWAWGPGGYYWVPGTWVLAPQPGLLWTPGYWSWNGNGYGWTPGYWAPQVGYYGGIDYGFGYFGNGYNGGRWKGHRFYYNTYVTHVDVDRVHNVYIDRSITINRSQRRISYVGGRGGLRTRPTEAQLAIAHERHYGMTSVQQTHARNAAYDRGNFYSANHGRPAQAAVSRPIVRRAMTQPHRVAPQRQQPHRAAPQRQQPHRAAPQRQQPHRAAPQRQQPHRAAPQRQQPHRATPQRQQPHRAAPQRQQPHRAAPQRQQPHRAAPQQQPHRAAPQQQPHRAAPQQHSNGGSKKQHDGSH